MLQDSAQAFLRAHHSVRRARTYRQSGTGFDPDFWAQLAQVGWLTMRMPETLGGTGLSIAEVAIVARELGVHGVADPIVMAAMVPSAILAVVPRSAAAARLADTLVSGGSTIAMMAGDLPLPVINGRLSARLPVYSLAPRNTLCLLVEQAGVPAIVAVEDARPGVSLIRQPHDDGSVSGRVNLDGVSIAPPDSLLHDGAALAIWRGAMHEGLIALSAQLTGVTQALLQMTLAYVKQRVQFGQAIGTFQVIQHRLVDLNNAVRLAGASCGRAVREHLAAPGRAAVPVHAAKARCSGTASDVACGALQLHGAMGYTDECDLAVFFRAATVLAQTMGNATWHRHALWQRLLAMEPDHG